VLAESFVGMTERLEYLFLLFPVVGIALFVLGLRYRRRLKAKAGSCVRTGGTVVGSAQGTLNGLDPTPVYHPVIEYFVDGQRFTMTADVGYGRRKKEGAKMSIMYNPTNPAAAFIVQDYYTGAHIMLGIGGTFVLLGSFVAYLILFSNR
jgi:hypothetical protein